MATHFHALKIKDIRRETAECVSIAFDIPDNLQEEFRFIPGQNITVRSTVEGEEVRRSYSICSTPDEGELRVAVKRVLQGRFSGHAHTLKAGDTLELLPPSGKFFTPLNPLHKKHYLAFAAGSGITPLISIIKATLAMEPLSQFTLVYGNRNRNSIIFREELEALKNKYIDRFSLLHILSGERTDNAINYGRIDAGKCSELNGKLLQFTRFNEFFICGPAEMIFSVKAFLQAQGVDENNIHFELFTSPGQKQALTASGPTARQAADAGKTSEVHVKLDGTVFNFKLTYHGESILDAALQQGVDLPYACKGGVCSTCRARLTEGQVEMDANYALEKDELEAGFILTCQSHPRSGKITVDYDAK
ncbi:MAG: phenylacetate-CoA oxygenase/reductase subunit PaaK [Chitinophagaceae bacterium]|nr:phenylacetate-CoA oxygenase/reductase subunit PaaK [Chitinophagaceae bacterium]